MNEKKIKRISMLVLGVMQLVISLGAAALGMIADKFSPIFLALFATALFLVFSGVQLIRYSRISKDEAHDKWEVFLIIIPFILVMVSIFVLYIFVSGWE